MAQNNYWGTDDPSEVEDHIFHQPDDPSRGLVDYLPLYSPPVNIPEQVFSKHTSLFFVSPNPATVFINIDFIADIDGKVFIEVLDMTGKTLDFTTIDNPRKAIQFNLQPQVRGVVFVKISANGSTETQKVVVR
jgi:hypothetical protein